MIVLVLMTLFATALPESVRCKAGSFSLGETASVTCYFHEDVGKSLHHVYVTFSPFDSRNESTDTDVLVCFSRRGNSRSCNIASGYNWDNVISSNLTIEIPDVQTRFAGHYSCHLVPLGDLQIKPCDLHVEDGNGPSPNLTTIILSAVGVIAFIALVAVYCHWKKGWSGKCSPKKAQYMEASQNERVPGEDKDEIDLHTTSQASITEHTTSQASITEHTPSQASITERPSTSSYSRVPGEDKDERDVRVPGEDKDERDLEKTGEGETRPSTSSYSRVPGEDKVELDSISFKHQVRYMPAPQNVGSEEYEPERVLIRFELAPTREALDIFLDSAQFGVASQNEGLGPSQNTIRFELQQTREAWKKYLDSKKTGEGETGPLMEASSNPEKRRTSL